MAKLFSCSSRAALLSVQDLAALGADPACTGLLGHVHEKLALMGGWGKFPFEGHSMGCPIKGGGTLGHGITLLGDHHGEAMVIADMTVNISRDLNAPGSTEPRPHPHPSTYLLQLVGLLVVPLQLLPQHVVLLREHLHHLLRPLHDGEGVGRQLRAWRCRRLARSSQGAREQGAGGRGGLRGHGAVLLGRRRWEGRLALPAAGKHRQGRRQSRAASKHTRGPPRGLLSGLWPYGCDSGPRSLLNTGNLPRRRLLTVMYTSGMAG